MKIVIQMSPEHYDGLLDRCLDSYSEYSILKNGVVTHDEAGGKDRRTIMILCDKEQAETLLHLATRLYPNAAPQIANEIGLAREQ
jgi:hypothetical protein